MKVKSHPVCAVLISVASPLVVTCTRRRPLCYPYSHHPLQTRAPFTL